MKRIQQIDLTAMWEEMWGGDLSFSSWLITVILHYQFTTASSSHNSNVERKVIFGDISNKSWFKFNFLNLRQLQLSGDKVGQCSILDRQTVHFTIINILTSKYVKLGVCKNIKSIFFFVNGKKLKSICRKRKQTETRQTDDTSDVKKTEKFKSKPHRTFYRFEWMNVCPKTSTANDACAVCIFSPNLSHWSQTILA